MKHWHPVSLIAFMMAATICLNLIIFNVAVTLGIFIPTKEVAEVMKASYTEILSLVYVFVGAMVQKLHGPKFPKDKE